MQGHDIDIMWAGVGGCAGSTRDHNSFYSTCGNCFLYFFIHTLVSNIFCNFIFASDQRWVSIRINLFSPKPVFYLCTRGLDRCSVL